MSLHEPTGWSIECDLWECKSVLYFDDQPGDEVEALRWAEQTGWIVRPSKWDQWCSLDCLLKWRGEARTLPAMYRMDEFKRSAEWHKEDHARECCRWHGTHTQPGINPRTHDWRDCPDPALRGTYIPAVPA